jgi:hypothetical protein
METINNKASSWFARGWLRLILVGGVTCATPLIASAGTVAGAPSAAPLPPTHLIGFPSVGPDLSAAVILKWQRSFGATSYEIFMGTSPGGEASTPVATVLGASAEIKELAGFTPYYFVVKAHNRQGDSAASTELKVMTGCDISCE